MGAISLETLVTSAFIMTRGVFARGVCVAAMINAQTLIYIDTLRLVFPKPDTTTTLV